MVKWIIAGIAVLTMIAAVVLLFLFSPASTSTGQIPEHKATDVRTMRVTAAPLTDWIQLPASVEPYVSNEVSSEVEGRIDWIGPKEGDRVEEDESILRIDQRLFRAQMEEAQAAHDLSVKQCRRAEDLHAEGIFSDEEIDQCRTKVATDAARLEIAKIQLEKATVKAPIAGVLNKSYFDMGEYVKSGDRVVDIVVIDPVKVLVKVPEKDIPYLRLGDKVHVSLDFWGEKGVDGAVSYVSVVGDRSTRTYEAEITVANPTHEILPSMIASVRIVRREIQRAVTVPLASVVPRGDYSVVFVEKDGKAQERLIELGVLDGSRIQIIKGIEADENLIVEGHRGLSDGEPVRVRGSNDVFPEVSQ